MKNAHNFANNRILIIDDNEAIHQDIRKILGGVGKRNAKLAALKAELFNEAPVRLEEVDFEVDSAFQGEEGLGKVQAAAASGRPYAMAFVDVRMPPGWDGVETIMRIWANHPDLQVVVCTAYADYSWQEMMQKIGRSDSLVILKKPFDNIEALQLANALTQKWALGHEVKCRIRDLDQLVAQRTTELQALNQEIARRQQIETALRASEEKYRSLVANIPDVVCIVNAKRELTYVSDNAEKILGYPREQLCAADGPWWRQCVHASDLAKLDVAYRDLFENGAPLDVECRFQKGDGQWIWLENRAPATRQQDGTPCADGLLSVVTQRKRVEEALQHAKGAAEAANRAKSLFLANMSHELRTPLNAILGFSEMLTDKMFGDLNDRQLKYVNNILGSGRHLLQLINDILDLSKVEAGRMELSRAPFSVPTALANVQAIVKTLANKKGLLLEMETASDLPLVCGDEAKFKQIMYNLLSNAIKFTPEAGKVRVVATRETDASKHSGMASAFSMSGECAKVIVTDTGIGIHPRDQERIFLEFEQVDSSYGRQQQGTGLGLALTKRLVEMHGGRIWVESEGVKGKGCAFGFLLPLPKAEPPSESPPLETRTPEPASA